MLELSSLSTTERKVLLQLERDARTPSLRIARKLRLSAEGVNGIIRRLQERRVIAKFEAKTHYSRLGYTLYNAYFTLRSRNAAAVARIHDLYKKHPCIVWMRFTEGAHDLAMSFRVKGRKDYLEMHRIVSQELGTLTQERDIALNMRACEFGLGEDAAVFDVLDVAEDAVRLRSEEQQLLDLLRRNARRPIVSLAGELGMSAPRTARMIKRLRTQRIVAGCKSIINPAALGLFQAALLFTFESATDRELARMREYARSSGDARYFLQMIGGYDLEIEVVAQSSGEFDRIIDGYRNAFPSIRRIDMLLYRESKAVR